MTSDTQLVVDIGNSFIKLAVFKGTKLVYKEQFGKVKVATIQGLKLKYGFLYCIFSTVRTKQPYFLRHLDRNFHLIQMNHKTKIPIKNLYTSPKTLGPDRLAAAIGAHQLYPGKNVLTIDLGTCIKYDFIDSKSQYHGGNIAPGLEMRLESMHILTSKLPRVNRAFNKNLLGKNTKEALQNGAVWGIKCEIERFIKTLTTIWGDIIIILSGGDSIYFGEIIESKIFVLPDLVLSGLNETLRYHRILKKL